MELGFAAAEDRSGFGTDAAAIPGFKSRIEDTYETNAVHIGMSVDVGGMHRVTVTHAGIRSSDATNATAEVLEIDIVALDDLVPLEDSCCCLQ